MSGALRFALAAAGAALAACGADATEDRVAALERRLAAAEAREQRLLAALREHGIPFRAEPPKDAAEATTRALEDLEHALARLESAKVSQDTEQGQNAMAALEAAMQTLRQDAAAALPAVLAKAEAAAPARQAALLECYARIGNAAAAPALLDLATATARPPVLRVHAARALVPVDAPAAIRAIEALLREAAPMPDLYLLVHLVAGTGRPEAAPVLAQALHEHRDRSVRCHAATGLGNFQGEAPVAALAAAAVADEYPAVRTNALRALTRVASAQRLREVAEQVAARDADAAVRAVARELTPASANR